MLHAGPTGFVRHRRIDVSIRVFLFRKINVLYEHGTFFPHFLKTVFRCMYELTPEVVAPGGSAQRRAGLTAESVAKRPIMDFDPSKRGTYSSSA